METRNVTFSLPVDLVRQAKIYAAQHETSVNSLVRDLLREKLNSDERARAAAARVLAIAERGPYFSIDPTSFDREDLHERR